MPLFQNSVVAKYLKKQDKTHLTKQWNDFKNHFHNPTIQENIRNSKEEQYQEGFLRDLFVKILGYSLNPDTNFNLTTEYKNVKDSKKADGAILVDDKVKAVIELKGTNTTDLGKIETQAFGYKNNQPDCVYVITSNFEKIRFYIDNAIEHIEFNLFTLTEADFDLLYLCLAFENISKNIAKKIKDESVSEEDVITKKLYKDYSLFKRELHQNLVQLNPEFDPLDLFKKSQKLLDRFLFLFFGEDRHLLPPNSVRLILAQWKQLQELDEYTPLYDRFKKYFGYLNTGYKGKQYDVYAYNGGLFKPDAILDSIKIDDDLLYTHTLKLSEYDFASEVDVNILGHIFENSLNELDEIKAQLEGTDIDKTKTKRKKDGVFYTPKYITKYIVENTIGKLCEEKKVALVINDEDYFATKEHAPLPKKKKQELLEKLDTYRKWLLQLTICDPACGSGAFLNQALDFLIEEHQYIDELQAKLFGDALVLTDMENSILENNLFGVDLNEESVEIAKLSLWLRTAQPNRKLNDLSGNIKCGNSLIDDPEVAGDKAFNWQQAFPQVFNEKQKKPFHITTAIHDSRTSQRMIDYKVRENRALGTMPEPQIIPLTEDEETIIVEKIAEIVTKDNLSVMAFNVCKDHMHLVLVCEEEEVSKIVQKIKAITARAVNIHRGVTITKQEQITMEHAPLSLEKHAPLSLEKHAPLPTERGEKQNSLWTQKFGCKEILDDNQLWNTIEYVKNNREKHELPILPILQQWSMLHCLYQSYEHAFRAEYKGGFDVIIGNPPYVRPRELEQNEKEFYQKKYKTVSNQFDLYHLFIEKIGLLINLNGIASYIVPNGFLSNENSKELRKYIIENFGISKFVNCKQRVFDDANVEVTIFCFDKKTDYEFGDFIELSENRFEVSQQFNFKDFSNNKNYIFTINIGVNFVDLYKKIKDNSNKLSEYFQVMGGIKEYQVGKGKPPQTKEMKELNIFNSSEKVDDTYIPEIRGKHLSRFGINWKNEYVSYGVWLAEPRDIKYFIGEKILIRQIPAKTHLVCGYTKDDFIIDQSAYSIKQLNGGDVFCKYVLALLNSKLIFWFFRNENNEFDSLFPKIKSGEIKNLPIKKISVSSQESFIKKADLMLLLNKEIQEVSLKFQRTLQRKFELTDLPKKLQDWYLLSYGEFIKELGKKKIKLSLSQEAEWEDYFSQEQQKAVALKQQIDTTDKEIDQMVYALYGLTEEEIAIVEKS